MVTDVYGNSQFADAASGKVLSSGITRLMLLDDDPNTPVISAPASLDVGAAQTAAVRG